MPTRSGVFTSNVRLIFYFSVCFICIFYCLYLLRFLNKIDVVELGGSDELCGKGYELSLFLFSDVLEISKKKSAAKGLGLRSPSTISLRSVGVGPTGTLNSNPGGKVSFL